jgi:hypothetical protein
MISQYLDIHNYGQVLKRLFSGTNQEPGHNITKPRHKPLESDETHGCRYK